MTLEEAERYLIQRALGRTDGSVSDAARRSGCPAARCTAGSSSTG